MKILPIFIIVLLLTGAASCRDIKKGENAEAQEEAAMMEGRNAARLFLHRDTTDTAGLHSEVIRAKSSRKKYEDKKMKSCAAAYDTGFVRTVRTVNPDLEKFISK